MPSQPARRAPCEFWHGPFPHAAVPFNILSRFGRLGMEGRDHKDDPTVQFTTMDVMVVIEIDYLRRIWKRLREARASFEGGLQAYRESRELLDRVDRHPCVPGQNDTSKPAGTL